MSDIVISRATEADLSGMAQLRAVFGKSDKDALYYKWKLFDSPFGAGKIWLAKDAGRVVGMLSWTPKGDGIYELGDAFIHPDYQGQRIFARLLASGQGSFDFGTPNSKAIGSYLRQGYKRAGIELRSYIGLHIGCKAQAGLPDRIPDDPNSLIHKTRKYLEWRFAGSEYQFWHTTGGYAVTKGRLLADYAAESEGAFKRLIPNGVVRTLGGQGEYV